MVKNRIFSGIFVQILLLIFVISTYAKNEMPGKGKSSESSSKGVVKTTEVKKTAVRKVEFSPDNKKNKDRNPFLSLGDIAKIKLEKQRQEKLRRIALEKSKPKPKETPLARAKRLIRIQGTINNQVIINGEPKKVGEMVFGAKIIRIDSNSVLFKIGNNYFKKRLP